jgi:hypothetical protein
VNVTDPVDTLVTNPAFVTVATALLLLIHVPPEGGLKVMVDPKQSVADGTLTVGCCIVTDAVVLLQPVAVSVNVNVTVPANTPVTKPAFVTVATVLSLLTQVPPVDGVKFMVAPTHNVVDGALTVGCCIVTEAVVLLHPVVPSVKVKVAVPADTPVTTPVFVTVASVLSLLIQVPPVEGLKLSVAATQSVADGALTMGSALIVRDDVVLLQPVSVSVKVNVTEPAVKPVTSPAFVTVAIALLLLNQMPPVEGLKFIVAPMQSEAKGALTVGCCMSTGTELLLQPVVASVKVKIALPAEIPVARPAFVTVATGGLLLIQVPLVLGNRFAVAPTQRLEGIVIMGGTVTEEVVLLQLVAVSVKVNVTVPVDTPVTTPALVTVATVLSLLTHVPPVEGLNVMVAPMHKVGDGVLTVGCCMVTELVVLLQPVVASVKVNVTTPADTPVAKPALVTVATALLLLTHAPPEAGLKFMVAPAQSVVEGALTVGSGFIVTFDEVGVMGEQPFASK